MHWSIFALLMGAVAGTRAQPTDSAVDSARPPPLPPRCGMNEHFESNSYKCQITCSNMKYEAVMGPCAPTSECYCNKGYVRNEDGLCIKREDCPPPRCPKGEVWNDCGSACPLSCANRDNTCLVCTMQCVSGCFCAGDTIRAPDRSCVKPKHCPPRTCSGPNEEFDTCPRTCPRTEKCENLWSTKPCTPLDCCEPKCRCKPGFYRNDKNVCVSAKECYKQKQCGPNEIFTECYNDCQKTCKNRFQRNGKVCSQVCDRTGCKCKENYLRHDNGTCVPEYQCSAAKCGEGEVYSDCKSSCSELCEDRGNTCLACAAVCVPGCYCAGKTFRAPDGSCVKPENCPRRTCGRNEVFDKCPPTCPRTEECKNLWSKEPCTPIDCCHPSCRCKPGYYRNKQNACVSARECRKQNQCGPNEIFTECYNDCQKTCKNRFQRNGNVCSQVCDRTGCKCKENYLRHDNGTCVPEYQCSAAECGEGEVYSDCESSCSELCEDRGNTCLACAAVCVPGCYCAGKTFRAPDGSCVKPENCPRRTCGRNEVFDKCPPTCPRTEECKNLWSKEPCTPIDCCHPSCRCKPGYYRNKQNACVSARECSGSPPWDE